MSASRKSTFAQLFNKAQKQSGRFLALRDELLDDLHAFKALAWELACSFNQLLTEHHNDFVKRLADSGHSVDQAMDEWFRPLAVIDKSKRPHGALVAAVSKGMTRKEYFSMSPEAYLARLNIRATSGGYKSPRLPIDVENLRNLVKKLRRQMSILKRDNTRLIAENRRLSRMLGRPIRKVA